MILVLHILQDSTPAGTIFAEDIVDVAADYEESKRDSKVSQLTNLLYRAYACIFLNVIQQHSFVFKILTKGRDYLLNAPSPQKKVGSHSRYYAIPSLYYPLSGHRRSGYLRSDHSYKLIEQKVHFM